MKPAYGLQPFRPDDHREQGIEPRPAPPLPSCAVCCAALTTIGLLCDNCRAAVAGLNHRRARIEAGDLNVLHDVSATAADVEAVLAARKKNNHSGVQNS